jgi:purine nucleosidase
MWKVPSVLVLLLLIFVAADPASHAKTNVRAARLIFDTDIGDDIDDAYALGLLLKSPEVKILGVTTAFGDTHLRARLVSRLLKETGNENILVFEGPPTERQTGFSQSVWAHKSPDRQYPDAIAFMLKTISRNPGEITLISVAPFTNVGALIAKDPATFRKLKRVVIMGGSVYQGYGDAGRGHPEAEWNIKSDIPAAKALFTSGVPLYVMPLDSTQIPLDLTRQKTLFDRGTPLTNALEELTKEWSVATHQSIPTLFDAIAAAYAVNPELCPTTPLRLEVDDKGLTRKVDGKPNANVCLSSNTQTFFDFYLPRVTH